MTTIFVSVQTGMAVRDLLRCGPLSRILSQPDAHVVLLTPGVRDPAFLAEFAHERVSVVAQQPYAPSTMVWRLMNRRWRNARSPWLADALHRVEERMVGVPPAYDELFRTYRPALAVIGDPLRPGDANLIAAAHRHGVPTLGSVRSWDNLQKHLRTRPDRLTVWNARNAREAVDIDRFRPWQVTEVGAPQLDVYFRGAVPNRDRFCEQRGLDPRKRILVLATSSFTYDSDQTYLVDMLLEAIRSREIREPVQVVLRLHPDDRVGRYLKYAEAPEVSLDIPRSYLATLGWTMDQRDLERMRALLTHADVMVNFATTVTLECAIADTPTLLVAFSPIDPEEMQRYVVGLHFRMHYKALVERDLVPIAWNRDELIGWINRYLEDPSVYRAQRAEIVGEWVQFTDGRSGARLGDAILRSAGLSPEMSFRGGAEESRPDPEPAEGEGSTSRSLPFGKLRVGMTCRCPCASH